MADSTQSERKLSQEYSWLAVVLAAIAGAVDGIGYLLLFHVFTSHMSGNSVAMMLHVVNGNWPVAWKHLEPIVVFFFGVVTGLAIHDALVPRGVERVFSVLAGIEAALLVTFLLIARPPAPWMTLWPACAMGIQNAMLRRVGHHRVRTTFITGMLTNAAQGLVERKPADFAFYTGIWLAFALGGITGTWIDLRYGSIALLLPICMLALLIAIDLASPLAKSQPRQASGQQPG